MEIDVVCTKIIQEKMTKMVNPRWQKNIDTKSRESGRVIQMKNNRKNIVVVK